MPVSLPRTIEAYFTASNAGAPEALAEAFIPTGQVRDEGEVHHGRPAIAAWARATMAKYRMRSAPLSSTPVGSDIVVTALVSGDFPGSPLELSYRFALTDDAIAALEIGA